MSVEYYYSPSFPNDGFPKELVESAREWRFKAARDAALDTAIPRYVKITDIRTGEDMSKEWSLPAWKILEGAEGEELPYGEALPAYSVESDGYKLQR